MQQEKTTFDLRGLDLVIVVGAWLIGILLNSWLLWPALTLLPGALVALLFGILLWRNPRSMLIMLTLFCLLLGAWRYSLASPVGDPQAIRAFIGPSKVEIKGSVTDEPKLQGRSRLLIIAVSSISTDARSSWQDVHGQLEVQTPGSSIEDPYGANYGDTVELQGKLQAQSAYSPPGIFASMVFPRISISSTGGNPLLAALYHLRVTLASLITQFLPQPEAALLVAVLLGLRTPALKPLILAFNVTGTAHFIAPSGFKVTILAGLVAQSTRWIHPESGKQPNTTRLLPAQKQQGARRRWISTTLVIISIAIYTVLSGAGPAALRAGIMGIILVVAPRIGRIYNVYTALALAALLMSIFDPFVLLDAGFQLSFLGTLGIVLFTPFFQRLLHSLERLLFGSYVSKQLAVALAAQMTRLLVIIVVELLTVTLAAQVGTYPIFAVTFNLISLIAPIVNVLTGSLLGVLIVLGIALCLSGLLFPPLGVLCAWIVWPILWYMITIIPWCASLPYAYLPVNNLNISLALGYYAVLTLVATFLFYKRPIKSQEPEANQPRKLSPRTRRLIQLGAALLMVGATGATVLAAQPDGHLTVTFLSVGPAGQPAQGQAILIRTPDGKTALLDGGLDATSLAQELDSRLPAWQRSLDVVVLTATRPDHLVGLQDIVTRYQVGEVLDAGMLHPSTAYALWRRTISQRNLPYVQIHQGTTVAIGTQVSLQVLWPSSPLHKGVTEVLDNALSVRLVAPGLHILFLGTTALSKYALRGLLDTIAPDYLQADIVQIVGETGKPFPAELSTILAVAHPSLLIVTPATLGAKQRKAGETSILLPSLLPTSANEAWEVMQTAEVGTLEMNSSENRWTINAA